MQSTSAILYLHVNIKYVSIFSTILSEIFLILRIIQQNIVINLHTSSWKAHRILDVSRLLGYYAE